MSFLNPWTWLLALGLLGSSALGYELWAKHERNLGAEPYIAMIKKNNDAAAEKLAKLTAEIKIKQKELDDFNTTRNENDATNETAIGILADKLHASRVLRDPNATGCSGGSAQGQIASGPQTGGADATQAGGVFSEPASELLLKLTSEADRVNDAYISCRADSYKMRE
jgi:hypothetical protein